MLGVTFGNKHSYNDWGIWLEDTHINPPLPKRYIVDVPARNGLLDLTPELTPTIRFENRTLTFNFRVKAGDWSSLVSTIYGDIHGRTLDVVSDLDPNWHWHGCVTVDDFSSDERTGKLVITVDADPFKLSNTENSYTVNGNGTITCVVDRMEISPAFEIEAPTTVIYGDSSYVIESTATTEKTLSGDIVSFADGTANPTVDLTVDIEAVQSGSGDPSPTNIRPISGWDEVNVTRTGKNLWGGEKMADDIYTSVNNTLGSDYGSDSDGNYITLLAGSYINEKNLSPFLRFKENTIYSVIIKFKQTTSVSTINIGVKYTDGTIEFFTKSDVIANNVYVASFQTASEKTVSYIEGVWSNGITKIYYADSGVFEGSVSVDDFVPYNGTTYTTDLDGTRYGGTLDVTTGVLTITHKVEVDLGTLTWAYETTSNRNFFYHSIGSTAKSNGTFICSAYKFGGDKSDAQMASVETGVYSHGTYIYIKDTQYTDATTFKNSLTGQQLVYELATPQVVQLTPTQVMILKNQNNIWADSGEVKVTYLAQDFAGKKFYIPDLELTEGSHELTIQGTGTTTVTYTNGRL